MFSRKICFLDITFVKHTIATECDGCGARAKTKKKSFQLHSSRKIMFSRYYVCQIAAVQLETFFFFFSWARVSYPSRSVALYTSTWWRRLVGCLKSQVIFRKRATNYRALLRKMTDVDKEYYGSTPPCTCTTECNGVQQNGVYDCIQLHCTALHAHLSI